MSTQPSFVDSEELAALLRDTSKKSRQDFLVIDVRDDDFDEGGHIPGAVNVPAHTLVDEIPTLVRDYGNVPVVYFHCALSQVRGPKSARIYCESLQLQGISTDQQVKILLGGFEGWNEKYNGNPTLVENTNVEHDDTSA